MLTIFARSQYPSRSIRVKLISCVSIALLFLTTTSGLLSSQNRSPNLLTDLKTNVIPFQEGERLAYEINWKPLFLSPAFKAGELHLRIQESQYGKRPTYTISAQARSDGLLLSVAGLEVRDYLESTIDRINFRSYRMLRQVRQNKRKRDLEVLFDYDDKQATVREVNLEVQPPNTKRDTIEDLPGPIADILSVFYVARLRHLKPGDEYLIHLSDIKNVKEVRVRVMGKEKTTTYLGVFDSFKVSTIGGIFNGGDLRVWFSADRLQVPIKFEADIKIGKVYGQITSLQTPRESRSVVRVP